MTKNKKLLSLFICNKLEIAGFSSVFAMQNIIV